MNRYKAEQTRAHREARIGKTPAEIEVLDREDSLKASLQELAHQIHAEKFPEEYDHYYDSIADAKCHFQKVTARNIKSRLHSLF